ncbi:hypothetical protein ACFP6A_10665 [Quadrisphaera sp. GCM10027208]|uniref:hypothetical protein n=1 Tax=Quadrisphaera sp. GCM10027208 TaxID=3273423 RepID=UPI003606326B
MGRHAAPAEDPPGTPAGNDLAAWGAFVVPLTVITLLLVGVGWPTALAVGALTALAFALVWGLSRLRRVSARARRQR